jgi:hypothetical protein
MEYRAAVAILKSVCVFCGSSLPADPRYRDAAVEVGTLIATEGLELVYGGGAVGLMGVVADAALAAGGRVVGVIPVGLFKREVAHAGLTELRQVDSMHDRKRLMYDLADGFIALPGGLGTLEELAEAATWSQLGIHAKPVTLLDVAGFWTPLLDLLDGMVGSGLLKPANRALIDSAGDARVALGQLAAYRPAYVDKWITPDER